MASDGYIARQTRYNALRDELWAAMDEKIKEEKVRHKAMEEKVEEEKMRHKDKDAGEKAAMAKKVLEKATLEADAERKKTHDGSTWSLPPET